MASPQFKVYSRDAEYVAACKHPSDAAALVALYGNGATIRYGHRTILWSEGSEDQSASESYDSAGIVMLNRLNEVERQHFALDG